MNDNTKDQAVIKEFLEHCKNAKIKELKKILLSQRENKDFISSINRDELLAAIGVAVNAKRYDVVEYLMTQTTIFDNNDFMLHVVFLFCENQHLPELKTLLNAHQLEDLSESEYQQIALNACMRSQFEVLDYLITRKTNFKEDKKSTFNAKHGLLSFLIIQLLASEERGAQQTKRIKHTLGHVKIGDAFHTLKELRLMIDDILMEACVMANLEIVSYLLTSKDLEYSPSVHMRRDAPLHVLACANTPAHNKILEYLIFDLKIESNNNIEIYFFLDQTNKYKVLKEMFYQRDEKLALEEKISANTTINSKNFKI